MRVVSTPYSIVFSGLLLVSSCSDAVAPAQPLPTPVSMAVEELEPEVLEQPVPLWDSGETQNVIDGSTADAHGYALLDLGEAWAPYLFTDGATADGKPLVNAYRATYLQLARGELPDDAQGQRARADKYLEPFGILPSLGWVRQRMQRLSELPCVEQLDGSALDGFEGIAGTPTPAAGQRALSEYRQLTARVRGLLRAQHVEHVEQLDPARLDRHQQALLAQYQSAAARHDAIAAVQQRLKCEGYLSTTRPLTPGLYDASLREALMLFERRHRIHGYGQLGGDTLAMLKLPTLQAELQGLLRVLTERVTQTAGVLEDGSALAPLLGAPRNYRGADGSELQQRDLFAEFRARVIDAFGLHSPQAALQWLRSLGALPADQHQWVALAAPQLPEYYGPAMDIRVEIDRGDVWYDFPYDDAGRAVPQAVERTPTLTVLVRYLGQSIPLARYATTIGGWRAKQIGASTMWRYQESPVGKRVWDEITAAPVWLPPETTSLKVLLKPRRASKPGDAPYEANYALTGPGYASALGLVAAYHSAGSQRSDGTAQPGYDEGIRTHSASDYMAVEGRQSNGCHRLHNHIAVRLMSWVLARRAHTRKGQVMLAFSKTLQLDDRDYEFSVKQGGYVFALDPPLPIEVLPGRIRGSQQRAIDIDIPQFDPTRQAYVTAAGTSVRLRGRELVEVPPPQPSAPPAPTASNPAETASDALAAARANPSVPPM